MGIEALRAALETEGRERAAEALRDGEARAAELRAEAAAQAARQQREALAREEATVRRAAHARVAQARRAAARLALEAREALLARVFARAGEAAPAALAAPEVRAWLGAGLRQALAFVPEGDVRVGCAPEIADWLREAVADREDVRVEADAEVPAGFRALGAGGALVVDATLERLLEQRWPELAIGVLDHLTPAEPAEPAEPMEPAG